MRRYLGEVVMARKLEVIDEITTEDIWDHTQEQPGRDGLVRHVRGFHALLPESEIEIREIVADEDRVVGVWTWHGVVAMAFLGIPAGHEVDAQVVSLFKLRDGMVVDYSLMVTARTMSEPVQQVGHSTLAQ